MLRVTSARLFLVDLCADTDTGRVLTELLQGEFELETSRDAASAAECVILVTADDASQPGLKAFLSSVLASRPSSPLIVAAARGDASQFFELLEAGAQDFLIPPFRSAYVLPRIWRLLNAAPPSNYPEKDLVSSLALRELVGAHPRFVEEVQKIPTVARSDATVLVTGETGVGKELFARAIHYLSPRARQPLVPLNCGAIPHDLFENELFGHEPGAFTGASQPRTGLIEEAEGGTLFLDEVDSLSPTAQVKLLRFVQDRGYRRLGSPRLRYADVRVVAAMNSDPEQAMASGRLRRDLYYRLGVILFALPPLRERLEDIPVLARHFLDKHAGAAGSSARGFSPAALSLLKSHDWPGNVRELEHVVERAMIFCAKPLVEAGDIPLAGTRKPPGVESFRTGKARVVAEYERRYIEDALRKHHGNIARAALSAGKNRRAFFQLMRKHRVDAAAFRTETA